jgi:NADPH-dependent 2,4-dienoyl-CoA reductase/sulfur reductase-like enzyme
VGGGITALELVEGLRARRVRTHYFLRGERYWSNVLDETESRIVEQRLREEGIQIHDHTELAEILGKRGRVAGVLTHDGRRIDCDLVAIAIGVRPRTELAEGAGLATERGILVDEALQTSAPGVFAAGDVAQVFDPLSGKAVLDTLWGVAVAQGRIAGRNMAGQATTYHKSVPFNVTRLAGLTTTIVGTVGRGRDEDLMGIARGDSETWRQLPDALVAQNAFDVNRLRLLAGERRLLGAMVMGDQTLSLPLYHLVARQADITPIREHLLRPDVRLGDLIAGFWADWREGHAAA